MIEQHDLNKGRGKRMKRLTIVAGLLAALMVAVAAIAGAATKDRPAPGAVTIQFLAVSDWHGQLDPINGVGGAAAIAAYWEQDRALNPNTVELTAGDDFGASPPVSNFFNEVPAVQAQRMMGIDVNTFGNHNFDRGVAHLQQMIDIAGATSGQPGTPFRYIASNLKNLDENLSGVDRWGWVKVGGLKIAVIGAVNEEAPTLVKPGSFGSIQITDAAQAVNERAAVARNAGADIVIVLTHKGVRGFTDGQPFGELIDLANAVQGVDVIFGDHTDVQYTGTHNGVLVVEARSKGLSYSRTSVTVEPGAGVVSKSSQFIVPTASLVTPNAAIAAMIADYRAQIAPFMSVQIGTSSVAIPRTDSCGNSNGRTCESKVGNTVTDAMRLTYGTEFAITNSGGLRADLTCPTTDNASDFCPAFTPPPFPITRGQVNAVLPFGNIVVTATITGAELKTALENGVSRMPAVDGRYPQVSGLCVTYDIAAVAGSRVTGVVRQAANGACTGPAVDLTSGASYSLALNDFMASGGDGYPNVAARATSRDIMDQTVADWIGANSPINPTLQGRIACADSNGATAPNCPALTNP
jgi:2',3'-cyclic-nucleotide 2'-phosphodiesterase (5'-nucleotidase family)